MNRILRSMTFPAGPIAGIVAAFLGLAVWERIHAQTPNPPEIQVVRGKVEDFTKTVDGETQGAVLDNDSETVLYWPARLEAAFTAILKPGDRVRATGRRVIGPDGNPRFLVRSLTNLRTGEAVENDDFVEAAPATPRIPPGEEPKEGPPRPIVSGRNAAVPASRLVVRGDVERFTESPRGELDGAILDNQDETVLHWPAELQNKFNGILKVGDRARATGHRAVSPTGNHLFVVKSVTNVRTGETVENPQYREPRPAPSAEAAPPARGALDLEQRLAQLETQIAELRREIARLRERK